jgi:SAM-dependent methyltransferase
MTMTPLQTWDPERYARNARYVADLAAPAVDLLAAQPGECVLDLGCGDGALTEQLVALGCDVVGIDGSAEQVAAARRRGVDARVMDGRRLDFGDEYDAVFSNMALHWMVPVDDVIAGVWRALRRGGRFVGEFGGRGCIATVVEAIHTALARRGLDGRLLNPWYFPGADDYAERLEARGFGVDFIALARRPTPLPGDYHDFMDTFGDAFTSAVAPSERQTLVDEIQELLRPKLFDPARGWIADYVVLRFAASKP